MENVYFETQGGRGYVIDEQFSDGKKKTDIIYDYLLGKLKSELV